jgi:hypothetical protein
MERCLVALDWNMHGQYVLKLRSLHHQRHEELRLQDISPVWTTRAAEATAGEGDPALSRQALRMVRLGCDEPDWFLADTERHLAQWSAVLGYLHSPQ